MHLSENLLNTAVKLDEWALAVDFTQTLQSSLEHLRDLALKRSKDLDLRIIDLCDRMIHYLSFAFGEDSHNEEKMKQIAKKCLNLYAFPKNREREI